MVTDEVIAFARDYVNHPAGRTTYRKQKIREALFILTGKKLAKSCATCYIEAVFTILKRIKMANYELRKGYVAQFQGDSYKDVKAFTNFNLRTDPGKYDPVAAEYLRRYPEREKYFIKLPKKPAPVPPPRPVVVERPAPAPEAILKETIETLTGKPVKKTRSKRVKKNE